MDFASARDCPRSFETKLERFNRGIRHKNEIPIKLTDYTKGEGSNEERVAQFVKDIHNRVRRESIDRSFITKRHPKFKSDRERHEKFTKQVLGLRRGKQYRFTKLQKTEVESSGLDSAN